jgi:hypothetical protein
MSKKNKEGRYVIDESCILPDILSEKTLYLNKSTKRLVELNVYEYYVLIPQNANFLIPIKNEKVAKLLFNSNRQEPPKKD